MNVPESPIARARPGSPLPRTAAAAVLVGLAALLGLLVPAGASAASASYQCRASALTLSVAGQKSVEPVVANGSAGGTPGKSFDRANCVSENTGAPTVDQNLGLSGLVLTDAVKATTSITPEGGPPKAQAVASSVDITNLRLNIPGAPDTLAIGAVQSRASATCTNGKLNLNGTSSITDIRLGGQKVSLDELLRQLSSALKPLGFLVQITPNSVVKDGNSVVVQPLRIRLLPAAGTNGGLIDLVVGETKIAANGDVCNDNGIIDPNPPTDGICPSGSAPVQQPSTVVLCIIPGTNTTSQVVIGTPNGAPSGGTVISLVEAKRLADAGQLPKSKCLNGPGLPYIVAGSAGSDRIIGTNGDDRILGLGGNDTESGVSGNDCLDGNTGSDKLYGGEGNDRVYGGTGNDYEVGGAGDDRLYGESGRDVLDGSRGNDRLSGAAGNDSLNGNVGNDRLYTGTGRNSVQSGSSTKTGGDRVYTDKGGRAAINVAVATKDAFVFCRSKRDIVRANPGEFNKRASRLRGCKKVLVARTALRNGKRVGRS